MDIVIYTGRCVHTMSENLAQAEAFAVCRNRFCTVGTMKEVKEWAGSKARVVDLGKGVILPGFIETHNHLSDQALNLLKINCSPEANQDIKSILSRLKDASERTLPGQWIEGFGYDDVHISDRRHLNSKELDAVVPNHPVFIDHVTGHMAYVNSRALAAGGIDENVPSKLAGGTIGRNREGVPNGLLIEPAAVNLIAAHIPSPKAANIADPLAQTINDFNRCGITSSHDAGLGWSGNPAHILEAYQNLASVDRLNMRVYLSIMAPYYRNLKDIGLKGGFGSDRLKLGSVKLFQDGSIQIHTAALRQPYHDRPDHVGEIIHSQKNLDDLIEEFHVGGFQLAVHCNGDAAISSVITSLEKAQRKYFRAEPRHLLIHCQMADEAHIERIKAVGAMPSYFINHVYYWGDDHIKRYLGPSRASGISPLAATLRESLPFTLHSDMPVTPVAPLFAVHCAVNRKTRSGKCLGPDQKVDVATALRAYTTWGARASFEEAFKGSIEPEKLADFIVLSEDPFSISTEGIKDIEVLATYLDGQQVWSI